MKKLLIFIACIIIVYAFAFFGSIFTANSVNSSWYIENKPSFTPPNVVFPIVWTILYFLIALSLYFSWINSGLNKKKNVAAVFGVNLVLNVLWSYLFFGIQKSLFAFVDIILIWFTIITMILVAGKIDRKAGWLLVPYLVWVSFAGILNLAFII